MNQLINEITGRLQSRRGREAGAITLCVISAVGGWYDLKGGAFAFFLALLYWIFSGAWLR